MARKKNTKSARAQKRQEAEERQKYYDGLSVTEKIANLDKKFGKGQGAKKERAKLEAKKKK